MTQIQQFTNTEITVQEQIVQAMNTKGHFDGGRRATDPDAVDGSGLNIPVRLSPIG